MNIVRKRLLIPQNGCEYTMDSIGSILNAMIMYYAGDTRRINHFLKVYGFAKAIGEMEGLDEETQKILEAAAVTHDIGIKKSEELYNSSAGKYQQTEGPPEAKNLLKGLGFGPVLVERVCWLIAHHHTYDNIQDMDYQILVEADFLVNAYEDELSGNAIQEAGKKLFKTAAGKHFLEMVYKNTI